MSCAAVFFTYFTFDIPQLSHWGTREIKAIFDYNDDKFSYKFVGLTHLLVLGFLLFLLIGKLVYNMRVSVLEAKAVFVSASIILLSQFSGLIVFRFFPLISFIILLALFSDVKLGRVRLKREENNLA